MSATVNGMAKGGLWLVMSCALLLIACSASDESRSSLKDPEGTLAPIISSEIRQAQNPVYHAPARDDLAGRAVRNLSAQVDLDQIFSAATAGSSAEHGEDFAILASIYLADDENGAVGPPEIATLVAANEKRTAEYIYNQMGIPESLGFEPATIDVQERTWLRTQIVAPNRVRTELALYVLYPDLFEDRDGTWIRFVTESVYVNSAWQLSAWANLAGPDRELTGQEKTIYFDDGRGYRRPVIS